MNEEVKYRGEINNYSFLMKDDVIEVWSDFEAEFPEAFIYLKEGDIKNKKDFEMEIAHWFIRNKA